MSKKLYRSRSDRKISGICGGIADYFNIDSSLVRLLTVIGAFASFSAVFWIYLVCIFIIPEE